MELVVIPFKTVFKKPRSKRANAAIRFAKNFLKRNFKKPIKLSSALNKAIFGRGENIPRKIRVLAKEEKDFVLAKLENEKEPIEKKKKLKKKEKEEKVEKEKVELKKVKADDKSRKD